MRVYSELRYEEREEINSLFANWLRPYTHDVILRVLERREEIINNGLTLDLLRELSARDKKEQEDFERSIGSLMSDFDGFKEFDPHNNAITHAQSYRDVLYDMYIRR